MTQTKETNMSTFKEFQALVMEEFAGKQLVEGVDIKKAASIAFGAESNDFESEHKFQTLLGIGKDVTSKDPKMVKAKELWKKITSLPDSSTKSDAQSIIEKDWK
jgi:hypothetical protein